MNDAHNIGSLVVSSSATAEDAANQAHMILISAVELASDITEQTDIDPTARRTAFALLYLLECAEKLAGFADNELRCRELQKMGVLHVATNA